MGTMLDKAWPTALKGGSQGEDEILLKHLLTWPFWPGFLNYFGKQFSETRVSTKMGVSI
jgi:hypothetical protein